MAAGGAIVRDNRRSKTLREVIAWNLPNFDLRWHVVEQAKARIAGLTIVPDGQEFITRSCETLVTVWMSEDPRPVRTIPVEFLCGNVVCLPDGSQIVAPAGNVLEFRQLSGGDIARRIVLDSDRYTAAKAAAYLPGTEKLAVGCQVIHNNGSVSGLLVLVDLAKEEVIHKTAVEVEPTGIASDPQGRWLCVVGKRKNRGHVLFWDLATWKKLAGGGAHGRAIDDVCVCPDGTLVATCGEDNIIRLWSTANWKTVAKLDEHACEGIGTSGLAWSADGICLAYANSAGAPPRGGVFVYQRGGSDRQWQLVSACRGQTSADSEHTRRHLRVFGSEGRMDTYGNFDVPANTLPEKCPYCTFPDIDALPQPYLLRRGVAAPGDFATAQLGNFLVRERARRILDVVVPGECKFHATAHHQTGEATDWYLAVPQVQVRTAQVPNRIERCPVCQEPKVSTDLETLEFEPPNVDIFKSQQWTAAQIAEEAKWSWIHILKRKQPLKARKGQWTRIGMDRQLWFSVRLILLFKQLGIRGFSYGELEQRRATAAEAEWIAAQVEKLESIKQDAAQDADAATPVPSAGVDRAEWLTQFLFENASPKPLANSARVQAWSRTHGIQLPQDYQRFATTVGNKRFRNLMGLEGLDVSIVGPDRLDCESFRRDPPENPEDDPEPDGLLFAIAVNGDCLCFDLLGPAPDYPVVYFDHETEAFSPYANTFAAAVHRLASGE